jgi:hypothetical protein
MSSPGTLLSRRVLPTYERDDMKSAARAPGDGSDGRPADRRCPQCRERALVLQRRHVSPPQLGEALVTEYYECGCCDARYQYSPAADRWRPIYS